MTGLPRNLVHVFSTFGAGGPQIRAVQLIEHLGADCHHVILAMDGCTDAAAQLPPGASVEFAEPPPGRGLLRTVRAQKRWLATLSPDLVLTYNWGAIESVVAARRLGLPLVHHEDGFGPEEVVRRHRRRNWIRRAALRGVPVVVPSAVLLDIAKREWRLPPARLHHLVNGVDLERFARAAAAERPVAVAGTVGGLRGEKDHATLLRAFAQLAGGGRLRLVGDGALRDGLERLAGELGIAARVDFVGAVADTAPEYRAIDVFVLSSRTEQMPIALLEAMASECAVVATDVGDVAALLPAVQRAFVVPKQDPAALAQALRTVLADAALRARLGAANRDRVATDYEARQCLGRFAALYAAATR